MKNTCNLQFTLLLFCFLSPSLQAQGFEKENSILGIGIGVGDRLGGNNLPLGAHFEKGVADQISVGAFAGYSSFSSDLAKITYILIGGRGSYHYGNHFDGLGDNWDLYGGLTVFYLNTSTKATDNSPLFGQELGNSGGSVDFGIFTGARYYFSDSAGIYAELGTGLAWIQLGLALRL
ncbi:MAG: hypothetical protein AAFR87_04320 [Bacteroidota bacterium]